ncbi:MAG TPA: hypothetical protein VHX88_18550 [Solirubrobacteraceae bacterium]|jgi:hypothetical protein|nr:hypothetical protein [Solirubrobacteraceae bacterium]
MNAYWGGWAADRLASGDSLEWIAAELERSAGIGEEERAALWLLAWSGPAGAAPRPRRVAVSASFAG